jgi:hypothetical protein
MALGWDRFTAEVARQQPVFWCRDDDAARLTPALQRLLSLARENRIPLAIAVVPDLAQRELFETLSRDVSVLQHGCDHRNRAAAGEKKTEFPASEPVETALARLRAAREKLASLAGDRALPVLAPPWNRIRRELAAALPRIGINGLSGYGTAEAPPGLVQCNTHVDIVAWRDEKRFIGDAAALELAMQHFGGKEPIGWLTHHAVHDAAAWHFLERLFALPGLRWARAAELFSYTRPAHG